MGLLNTILQTDNKDTYFSIQLILQSDYAKATSSSSNRCASQLYSALKLPSDWKKMHCN